MNDDINVTHASENNEDITVTLTLENDEVIQCTVITIFEVKEQAYIAMVPDTENDDEESQLFIYRYAVGENGEPLLSNIESDEEYEYVADALDEIFEELDAEDEEEHEHNLECGCSHHK